MSIRSQAEADGIFIAPVEKKYDTDVKSDREILDNLCKNMTQVEAYKHNEIQKYLTSKMKNKLNNAIKKLKQPTEEIVTNYTRGFIIALEECLTDIEIVNKKVDIEIKK